jgi:CheY-like chemotaxis protein
MMDISMMTVEEFLDLFVKELEENPRLRDYYQLIDRDRFFLFRKAYLHQRLAYVEKHVQKAGACIWDVGCGYANASIFLALNGHKVVGSTLEYYYDQLQHRLAFWSKYGNIIELELRYENIFDALPAPGRYDYILAQDTLHHLEPLHEALILFKSALNANGRIIVSEENGSNLYCSMKHFGERGFKRIIRTYDEKLGKTIMFGNENTRSYAVWKKEFCNAGFELLKKDTEFIRFFPPPLYHAENYRILMEKEQKLWRKIPLLKDFFFFGINFTAGNKNNMEIFNGKTIMVVDDEEFNWLLFKNFLDDVPAEFLWARVAQEAIDIVASGRRIDLVLMDIKMPYKDGYTATREIKILDNSIPVIAQTAYASDDEKQRCFDAGCVEYVSKPIDYTELRLKMARVLRDREKA